MEDYVALARGAGFTDAAVLDVADLTVVPEYRRYCEQNLCGNYGVLDVCPPRSGSVEQMSAVLHTYRRALVLTLEYTPADMEDAAEHKKHKKQANELTEALMARLRADGRTDLLMMGAGPWKNASCMSAYCVDAQKMADLAHLKCWENDGKVRLFSLILYR